MDQGISAGIPYRDIDVPAAAMAILSSIEGYIYLSILKERIPPERALTTLFTKYVLPGMVITSVEKPNKQGGQVLS